jgi:hypothetical protein
MNSVGMRALSITFPMLHSRTIELIVASHCSKLFLHFSKSFAIFCEGEWLPTTTKMCGKTTYLIDVLEMKTFRLNELIELIKSHTGLNKLIELNGFVGLCKLIKLNGLIGHNKLIELNGLISHSQLTKLSGLVCHNKFISLSSVNGLLGRKDLVDHIGLFGHIGFIGRISHNGLDGFFGCNDLVGFVDLVNLVDIFGLSGIIGHNSLVSVIGLSLVGFSGLSLVSLVGLIGRISLIGQISLVNLNNLIGQISLVGLIGLGGIIGISGSGVLRLVSINDIGSFKNLSLINFVLISFVGLSFIGGFVGLASLVGFIGLDLFGFIGIGFVSIISLVSSRGVSTFFVALCNHNHLAAAAAKTTRWLKHTVSHGVATPRISTSKILNAATVFYATSSLHACLFVREMVNCWWLAFAKKKMWLWIAILENSTTVTCYILQNNYFFSVFHKL